VDVARSGAVFLVMELVAGPTLEDQRKRFGDLSWARPILKQIAEGLAAVHAEGVVHRDLKPSNVLVTPEGTVKIADFGVSTLKTPASGTDATTPELTRTGAILGTPMYMAPELVNGARDASQQADVFSFGVLAYELACGRHPFGEPPACALLYGSTPPRFGESCALPPALSALLDRCLAADAAKRPAASEIAAAC
jgi:serine/threonine protein kinase